MGTPGGTRKEVIIFAVISLLVFAYIIARAALVPIVHDEAATFFHYVLTGNFLPGVAHWDANNHVLNSGLTILSSRLFGDGLLALRSANVLSFLVWSICAWWIVKSMSDVLVRWCTLLALLLCPFLLDYFSLCRGYGLGMAFFLLTAASAFAFIRSYKRQHFLLMLWAATIAIWADLALIPALGIMVTIAVVSNFKQLKRPSLIHWKVFVSVLTCGALWVAALLFAHQLSTKGLLYNGSLDGFTEVTLRPLFKFILGNGDFVFITIILMFVLVSSALGLFVSKGDHTGLVFTGGTLLLLWSVTELAAHMMHINYPEDRSALQFAVLFILLFAQAIDAVSKQWKALRFGALALLVLPIRTISTANVEYTLLWPEQSLPSALIDAAESEQLASKEPLVIGLYHQHALVWAYAQRQQGQALPQSRSTNFPDPLPDLLLTDARYTNAVSTDHISILKGGHDGLELWKRGHSLNRQLFFEQPLGSIQSTDEFIDLPKPSLENWPQGPVLIRVSGAIHAAGRASFNWVVSADHDGEQIQYLTQHLHITSGSLSADQVQVMDALPPNVDRSGNYLWNPDRHEITIREGHIQYFQLIER